TAFLASHDIHNIQQNCNETDPRLSYLLTLMCAIIWPWFVIGFICIYLGYFIKSVFTGSSGTFSQRVVAMSRPSLIVFLTYSVIAFCFYVIALAVVGPPDMIHVVGALRDLNLAEIAKKFL